MIDVVEAIARFERSTRSLLDALEGVSEQTWRLRPAEGAWSVAETVEHVVLANRLICSRLAALPAAPFPPGVPRLDDAAISADIFDGAAPPPVDLAEPKGCFASRAEGIAALVDTRERLLARARGTGADLRACGLVHPVFGVFDGVQWILFAAAHADNHLPQLRALSCVYDVGDPVARSR